MSAASKCDRCLSLYEHAVGNVSVEYHQTTEVKKDGSQVLRTWNVDLCGKCSELFIDFIDERRRILPTHDLAALKRRLESFNTKTREWKP